MVDRYWQKIEDVENYIENSIQISSILLKLEGYDEKLGDLSKIGNNENNISSNLSKIDKNKDDIASNLGKIDTNKDNISSNLKKINNIENDMTIKIKKDIYKKTFIIPNMSTNYNSKKIGDKYINSNLTTDGIIKIDANYNYSYDGTNKFSHIYKFYNNYQKFKEVRVNHNIISNVVNDKFDIQGINSTKINLLIYLVNSNKNNKSIDLFDYNTVQVIYNDNTDSLKSDINKSNISSNLGIINTNKSNISSNLEIINDNKEDILSLKNSNIKSFYNLDKIFIYDIPKGHQNVDKDNYHHMFEKEIIYNFIKDSYLEIILKVLTKISNYVLIGYFQILCNFYDENDDLFYTISLSTAMGSINKLSTIKSVFMVPINKSMNKIKINFFIMPKNQQNRSAKFIIYDINSNKIYLKYYQKTDEMSIKNIEDSLNTVNNISADLEKIDEKKNNISTNLININTNEDNIAYNLEEINYI